MRGLVTCKKCGWIGKEGDLVEKDEPLERLDYFYFGTFFGAVKRRGFYCPRCRARLLTARVLAGAEQLREDAQGH